MDVDQEIIYVRIEGDYRVPSAALAGTDAVLIQDFQASRFGLEMAERNPTQQNRSKLQSPFAGSLYQLDFRAELKGVDSLPYLLETGNLLSACHMTTQYQFQRASYGELLGPVDWSVTITRWIDGKIQTFSGCRGDFTLTFDVHQVPMFDFSMIGFLESEVDGSIPVTPIYSTRVPQVYVNARANVDDLTVYLPVIKRVELSTNNDLATPLSANAANGYSEVSFGKRMSTIEIELEDDLLSLVDFRGAMEANASLRVIVSLSAIPGEVGNRIGVFMANIQWVDDREIDPEDHKVLRTMVGEAPPGELIGSSGIHITNQ